MNTLALRSLSAKITSSSMMDFAFARRIEQIYPFGSPDDCLEILSYLLFEPKKLNTDNLQFSSYKEIPILYANIIDSSVCYLIREAFRLREKLDMDPLAYYNTKIETLLTQIREKKDHLQKDDREAIILMALHSILYNVMIIMNPVSSLEEDLYGLLASLYYNLMFTIYSWLIKISIFEKEYLSKMRDIYLEYLTHIYNLKVWHKELNHHDF